MKTPNFKAEDQERKFWEKHSVADYWNDLLELVDTIERPKLTPVTVKFDPLVLRKIKMLAKKRGVPYNAYIRYLLSRGVEDEISSKPSHEKSGSLLFITHKDLMRCRGFLHPLNMLLFDA
jgi:predicted DNA binding CopG/RHH family protein